MLGVFCVSLGYGAVLPALPYRVGRLLGIAGNTAALAQVTGWLTGLYTLALFAFAPVWGWLSDQFGRRAILTAGVAGFGVTMSGLPLVDNIVVLYAERLASGLFAAAVTPVALTVVADLVSSDDARAHRLSLVSLAGTAGFLLGPMLGAFAGQELVGVVAPFGIDARSLPEILAGALAILAAGATWMTVPVSTVSRARPASIGDAQTGQSAILRLLFLSFVVAASVAVFEVGLALRGQQTPGLTPYQVALMFSECSLVMVLVQSVIFSPLIKARSTRWFIAPALVLLAAGLFLLPRTNQFGPMLVLVALIASGAGVLSPIATFWISRRAGAKQGTQLGRQTAAASLGATIGSILGGFLFDLPVATDASFLSAVLITLAALIVCWRLPRTLVK